MSDPGRRPEGCCEVRDCEPEFEAVDCQVTEEGR
jgi:hypothetical protein